jgi:hypothetical protein
MTQQGYALSAGGPGLSRPHRVHRSAMADAVPKPPARCERISLPTGYEGGNLTRRNPSLVRNRAPSPVPRLVYVRAHDRFGAGGVPGLDSGHDGHVTA